MHFAHETTDNNKRRDGIFPRALTPPFYGTRTRETDIIGDFINIVLLLLCSRKTVKKSKMFIQTHPIDLTPCTFPDRHDDLVHTENE